MFMLATPVLTAVIEWPLWGIELSPLQWLGSAIILGGLACLIRMEWQMTALESGVQVIAAPASEDQVVAKDTCIRELLIKELHTDDETRRSSQAAENVW